MFVLKSESCGTSSSLNDRSRVSIKTNFYRTNAGSSRRVSRITMRCRWTILSFLQPGRKRRVPNVNISRRLENNGLLGQESKEKSGGTFNPAQKEKAKNNRLQ